MTAITQKRQFSQHWRLAVKKYPIAALIEARLHELNLDPTGLGLRLGYKNPAKAAGRVHAICAGLLYSPKSKAALPRLVAALELPATVVEQAILETRIAIGEEQRTAREKEKLEREAKDAEWRKNFRPHAVILTERRIPSQITFCGLTGGAAARLIIPFDSARRAVTFVDQAVAGLHMKAPVGQNGRRCVMFFGEPTGLVLNYSPDLALRCDLEGNPIEWLSAAYRIGEVELSIGNRTISPAVAAAVLRLKDSTVISVT
jgi:hypothetical protein